MLGSQRNVQILHNVENINRITPVQNESKKLRYLQREMVKIYYHCHRCQKEASNNCLLHKQLIEIFRGSEVQKLSVRKRFQCHNCFKINFSADEIIHCPFCSSRSVFLV